MNTVIFLDLDDTIFQTLPKCPPAEPTSPAAFGRDGAPLSYMTARQRALLELLLRAGTVVPTTARSVDAFRRVDLPFTGPAIVGFGGIVLLPDGRHDPAWDAQVRPQCEAMAGELRAHLDATQRFIAAQGLGANARIICDLDLPLYVVVKHPKGDHERLVPIRSELWAAIDPERFFIHQNGNNLSLVPRFLGKDRAVRHVLAHHVGPGPVLTLGVGDSLSDAPFLAACDFALLPRGCQLAGLLCQEGR